MYQQLLVEVNSLQVCAELVYSTVQLRVRLQSMQHSQMFPYVSAPCCFQTKDKAQPLRFRIPQTIEVAQCYAFLEIQLQQQLQGAIRPIFALQAQLQLDGEFMGYAGGVFISGFARLFKAAKPLANGSRLVSIPALQYVPHEIYLYLSGQITYLASLVVYLDYYSIVIPFDGQQTITAATFLAADMAAFEGDFMQFYLFVTISLLENEVPLLCCSVVLNTTRFSTPGASLLLRIDLARVEVPAAVLQCVDAVLYLEGQRAVVKADMNADAKTEIKIKDLLKDLAVLKTALPAVWGVYAPSGMHHSKQLSAPPGWEALARKLYQTVQKRKKAVPDYEKFDFRKRTSEGALKLLIQACEFAHRSEFTSSLQYLTRFQDADDYGARVVFQPLSKQPRAFGMLNASAAAFEDVCEVEMVAEGEGGKYTCKIANPDAMATLLTEIPSLDDFQRFSGVALTAYTPESHLEERNGAEFAGYRAHYTKSTLLCSLFAPSNYSLSLPEAYDSIQLRGSKLSGTSVSVPLDTQIDVYYCFRPFAQLFSQLAPKQCEIRPFCPPESLRSELFAQQATLDEDAVILSQLAGIQLVDAENADLPPLEAGNGKYQPPGTESAPTSFSRDRGVQTEKTPDNITKSKEMAPNPRSHAAHSSSAGASAKDKQSKARIRNDILQMRDDAAHARDADAFRHSCAGYTTNLKSSWEREYFARLEQQAADYLREYLRKAE